MIRREHASARHSCCMPFTRATKPSPSLCPNYGHRRPFPHPALTSAPSHLHPSAAQLGARGPSLGGAWEGECREGGAGSAPRHWQPHAGSYAGRTGPAFGRKPGPCGLRVSQCHRSCCRLSQRCRGCIQAQDSLSPSLSPSSLLLGRKGGSGSDRAHPKRSRRSLGLPV